METIVLLLLGAVIDQIAQAIWARGHRAMAIAFFIIALTTLLAIAG
jgi:hypothetical protein